MTLLSPTAAAAKLLNSQKAHHFTLTAGRAISLAGVVLPLLLIGLLKFTQVEVEALKPLISGTPWLAWLYQVFGFAGTSYLLGVVEMITAVLFIASLWSVSAGIVAGALGALIFLTTVSTLFALPIWDASSGGFPFLNFIGTFLIKDVALLGVSLAILGESLLKNVTAGH
ncbi:hypothetical protein RU07_17425 [Agrobacterium tumefaciens]|uniref:DUF417 family protein n=1 Tax=Agrobacterium tumefaciens TaxID=358 RepID=A0A0D0JXF2_AGRTU|nr:MULTISPECIES: DUF417 family protein [unclassified Rhizobium]KIQ00339.1 hypothetical protein RU07_17425 [Agrobacterium tumefaciens]MBD8687726.1 DUF417 family protein [Rhizobium sp. CFBP 13644]MBD8692180.1 DUF417 family protein [Rhizobium sp. CFBP 13717]